ncbi:epidermal growth factor receptor-like [Amblyomma americanum]
MPARLRRHDCVDSGRRGVSSSSQLGLLVAAGQSSKKNGHVKKGKICIGTNGRMSVPSNREHHYQNLRDRYTNCTYVDGNLELTWLQESLERLPQDECCSLVFR